MHLNQESFLEEVTFKMCFNQTQPVIDRQREKQKFLQRLNLEPRGKAVLSQKARDLPTKQCEVIM